MAGTYHILNGDALLNQLPTEISGERIVMRECLVDGEVQNIPLEQLYKLRAEFLARNYGVSAEKYFADSVSQFEEIKRIPANTEVYLWFEDDLFCQVNLWFVAHLLFHYVRNAKIFLVRPKVHTSHGFGGLQADELTQLLAERRPLIQLDEISALWECYSNHDVKQLVDTVNRLKSNYPFIYVAVQAHLQRIPTDTFPGRPTASLIQIIKELGTADFAPVFKAFCERESIYGYGDLQVKRLLERINLSDLKNK